MRREFILPEEDREYLEKRGLPWETIVENGAQWLLVNEFPVPDGYNQKVVTAALSIHPQYPDVQIDMVYFYPILERSDLKAIPNLTPQALDGKNFQRWSRHLNGDETWRLGVDGVGTHLLKVTEWLRREFRVRP